MANQMVSGSYHAPVLSFLQFLWENQMSRTCCWPAPPRRLSPSASTHSESDH
jgi:hypothetical protein